MPRLLRIAALAAAGALITVSGVFINLAALRMARDDTPTPTR